MQRLLHAALFELWAAAQYSERTEMIDNKWQKTIDTVKREYSTHLLELWQKVYNRKYVQQHVYHLAWRIVLTSIVIILPCSISGRRLKGCYACNFYICLVQCTRHQQSCDTTPSVSSDCRRCKGQEVFPRDGLAKCARSSEDGWLRG